MKRSLHSFILLLALLFSTTVFAQPGTLDNTFGTSGKFFSNNGIPEYSNSNIALQTDGKIIIGGYADYIGTNGDFVLARYTTSGALDVTFSGDGLLTTDILGNSFDVVSKVIVLSTGKILVGGYSFTATGGFAVLARYNSDGTLDNTFDTDGKASLSVANLNTINGMVVQTDNKIVLCGDNGSDFLLIRFNADGTPDNTFGTNGISNPVLGNDFYAITGMAIQSDNKVVVSGLVFNSITFEGSFIVARYATNGALDLTYDTDGSAIVDFGTDYDQPTSISVLPGDKVLISGFAFNDDNLITATEIARLTNTGTPDVTFDGDGKYAVSTSTTRFFSTGNHISLSDNKIMIAGIYKNNNGNFDFALLKLNSNGGTDNTFDGDGIATSPANTSEEFGYDLLQQTDGKILLGGSASPNNISLTGAIARFTSAGALDNTFDSDGIATTPGFGTYPTDDDGRTIKLQNDGKMLVAGVYTPNGTGGVFVTRLNSNGTIDNTFGPNGNGRAFKILPFNCDLGAMQVQSDGKMVLAGSISDALDGDNIYVLRFNANGTLDNTFGNGGLVVTDLGASEYGLSLALQSDNKIILTAYSTDFVSFGEHLLLRYNTNGTTDATFGGGSGVVVTGMNPETINTGSNNAQTIAIQSADNKIIIITSTAGTSPDPEDFAVRRYNADGTIDASFNGGNILKTNFNNLEDIPYAVAVQGDGKIVITGETYNGTDSRIAVARLTTAGALDNTFDGDGKNSLAASKSTIGNSIAFMTDGRIVIGGYRVADVDFNTVDSTYMLAARLSSNGTPDASFGKNGVAVVDSTTTPKFDFCNSMALQTDGKILLAGNFINGGQADLVVYRLNGDFPTKVISPNSPLHLITVNPNPVTTQVLIQGDGIPNGRYQYNITTMDGKLIGSGFLNVTGRQLQQYLPAALWPKGTLLFSISNNKESKTFKLIKQ